jgi:antitoxin MazE
MRVKVQKWGNSLGLRIPKAVAVEAGIQPGAELDVRVENGQVVAAPTVRIPTFDELVAGITPENVHHDDEWLEDEPVGREII